MSAMYSVWILARQERPLPEKASSATSAESGLNPASVAVFVSFTVWLDASRYDNSSRTPDKDIIVANTDLEDGGFGQ